MVRVANRKYSRSNQKQRNEKQRILIVTEGSASEPDYLKKCTKLLRIGSQTTIIGQCGTDWDSILKYAKTLATRDRDYDLVYCVVDEDGKPNINDFVLKVENTSNGKTKFHCVYSVPCFEFWLLCHFDGASTSPFENCSAAEKRLRNFIPNYDKSKCHLEIKNVECIQKATTRCDQILQEHEKHDTINPSSTLHLLMEKLIEISNVNKNNS